MFVCPSLWCTSSMYTRMLLRKCTLVLYPPRHPGVSSTQSLPVHTVCHIYSAQKLYRLGVAGVFVAHHLPNVLALKAMLYGVIYVN